MVTVKVATCQSKEIVNETIIAKELAITNVAMFVCLTISIMHNDNAKLLTEL